jgi:hypothetical protein
VIGAPPSAVPPSLGPLAAPEETELVAAWPELREQALTLSWAAVALGSQVGQLKALARAGEMLVIPGPWPMRRAHRTGLGYFVPAWQLGPGGHGPHAQLSSLLEAVASVGWTSLELDRFMTTPIGEDGTSPAELLRSAGATRVVRLILGGGETQPAASAPANRRPRRTHVLAARIKAGSRRLAPPRRRPGASST